MEAVKILNAHVLSGSIEDIMELSEEAIKKRKQIFGTGINLNQLYLMNNNPEFAFAIEQAVLCPPFGVEKDPTETKKILQLLEDSRADILLMALSAPKQEFFVEKYRREFQIPVIFGAGIAIDYFAGRISQAPEWINKIGLEWLYRMVQEPGRLFERYIIHDLPTLIFMWRWDRKYRNHS